MWLMPRQKLSRGRFPGQIPNRLVIAEELKGNVVDLEGHELVAVELGHTDTDYTTCLHVSSIASSWLATLLTMTSASTSLIQIRRHDGVDRRAGQD